METRRKMAQVAAVCRRRWIVIALVMAPIAVLFSACSEEEGNGVRRGLTGDSCARTDDCAEPLRCLENVCAEPPSTVPDAGMMPDVGPGPGPSADAGPWSACDECLEGECGQAETACGPECRGLEACIETTCARLSEIGSPDESTCFVDCQNKFAAGKQQHLNVVNCAQGTKCQPPCTFYPQDYELCRTFMDNGDCFGYKAACDNSLSCKNFRDCVKLCSTLKDCLACDDTPEGQEGRALLEAYEQCVAGECLTESWIP